MDVNKTLLQKYYRAHCNEVERQIVEEWLMSTEAFTGTTAADNNEAKDRMWRIIYGQSIGNVARKRNRQSYIAIAACLLLLLTTGIILWDRFNRVPPENAYVVIDNTHHHLLAQQHVGNILLSESANSALKYVAASNSKGYLLYANSLIINNQQGEDIWVYLKISSEKRSGMIKFLCRKKRTYVAGYVTEHSNSGNRKYLYSQQLSPVVSLPEEVTTGINSQLNATRINAKCNGYTAIII